MTEIGIRRVGAPASAHSSWAFTRSAAGAKAFFLFNGRSLWQKKRNTFQVYLCGCEHERLGMKATSAIVMAGYNNKWAVRKYAKIVAEHYGERFIETGYKPLREFETLRDGQLVRKPLIRFTLEELLASDRVAEIVIVGHQMLLERRLRAFLNHHDKPCRIINQNARLPAEVVRQFELNPRKVKYNSIAGNMIKGYAASAACDQRAHALFVASDSPLTSRQYIERFLERAEAFRTSHDIVVPAVVVTGTMDRLGRYPMRLINDSEFQIEGTPDNHGRYGFRLSSLLFVNPWACKLNTANTAYSLRKCLNPNMQLKLFRITRSLGYENVYSKYFIRKDLSIREVENITSAYFGGRLKIIPVRDVESSYDYDGTDEEFRQLSELLRR
jgi:2-C-methyl-D-erythritol 4-phosphate cytidylyltransferase